MHCKSEPLEKILLCLALLGFTCLIGFGQEVPLALATATNARVLIVRDSAAIDAFLPRATVVQSMVDRAITYLTHKQDVAQAWLTLVSPKDLVGLKVYSLPGANSGTRPAVVEAVIKGLLSAGVPNTNICIWDKQLTDLRMAGYFDLADRLHVRIAGSAQSGYDLTNFYESPIIGNLVWGDVQFGEKGAGVGRKSFVSKLLSKQFTRIINIPPLLNHNAAGVSGALYSLASGSVDNFARFEVDEARLATAVPEIYALPALSDRVALNIVDALICQYEGGERGLLHYSAILDELRFSKDPVALDVLSLKELEIQRLAANAPQVQTNLDLYANAALLELGVNQLKRIDVERIP